MIPQSANSCERFSHGLRLGASSPQPQDSRSQDGSDIRDECLCHMMLSTTPLNPKFLQGIGMHTTAQIPASKKHRKSESTEATDASLAIQVRSSEQLQQFSSLPGFSVVNRYDSSEEDISFAVSAPIEVLSSSDASARAERARSRVQGASKSPQNKQLIIAPINIARRIRLCKRTADPDGSQCYPAIRATSKDSTVRGVAPSSSPKVRLFRLQQKS